jgi:hypothetical protein
MNSATTILTDASSLQSGAHAHPPMKALVYHGPGKRAWEEKPRPVITDAIVLHLTREFGSDLLGGISPVLIGTGT